MRRQENRENTRRQTGKKNGPKTKKKIKIQLDKKQMSILLVVSITIVLIIAINNYTSLGLVLDRNIDSKDAIQVTLQTSSNEIIPFGNEILVYNKGTITIYNSYGKNTGKIVLEDTIEASINTCGKYIQAINKDKGVVFVYKNKYEVARIKIEGEIYSGSINKNGTSVIEYSSNGNKTQLGIYDNSGNMKYNVKLSNNIIGKYVLSSNSKYLAYVDVNVSGISAQTNINLIDLSKVNKEQTTTTTIYTADNNLAYDIYWTGNILVTRFDENYMTYNVNSAKKQIIPISEGQVVNVSAYDKRYAYTKLDESGNYVLSIKKLTPSKERMVELDDTPKYFTYENGIAYVCYQKKIEAYNNFGMKIKNYDSDMIITEPVVFNSGRSIVMAISNKLIMFTI